MILAAILLAACLIACGWIGAAAWRGWLAAAFILISLPVGALGLIMSMRLIPGEWAREAAPFLESQAALAPLGAAAMLPVLIALPVVYRWVGVHQATAFRAAWLTPAAYIAVTVCWIAIVFVLALSLIGKPGAPRAVSCVGLILFLTVGTFADTDWVQSLDPDFNSSGFPLYLICLQIMTALATAIVFALAGRAPLKRPGILGGVLLMLLLMWAYFAFMPYFINWSANTPASAVWYLRRGQGVWSALAWLTAALRFIPAFLLLFRTVRNEPGWLLGVSAAVLLGAVPEVAWLVLPAPPHGTPADIATAAIYSAAIIGMSRLTASLLPAARAWAERRT